MVCVHRGIVVERGSLLGILCSLRDQNKIHNTNPLSYDVGLSFLLSCATSGSLYCGAKLTGVTYAKFLTLKSGKMKLQNTNVMYDNTTDTVYRNI